MFYPGNKVTSCLNLHIDRWISARLLRIMYNCVPWGFDWDLVDCLQFEGFGPPISSSDTIFLLAAEYEAIWNQMRFVHYINPTMSMMYLPWLLQAHQWQSQSLNVW